MTKTQLQVADEQNEKDVAKKVQQELAVENRDALRDVLRHSEIKRINERLTKKEVCNIYDLNYNFYMNCLSGRNVPSKKMDVAMREYLGTPTDKIYQMVFSFRKKETEYHPELGVTEDYAEKYRNQLVLQGVLKEPVA